MNQPRPRFLIDVCVGTKVEQWLIDHEYNVRTVRSIDPRMRDIDVLSLAEREDRILLSLDLDFGELVYKSGRKHCGVLILRMEEDRAEDRIAVVSRILDRYGDELHGHFCVYSRDTFRIR